VTKVEVELKTGVVVEDVEDVEVDESEVNVVVEDVKEVDVDVSESDAVVLDILSVWRALRFHFCSNCRVLVLWNARGAVAGVWRLVVVVVVVSLRSTRARLHAKRR
jgi:hypothetical protein